MKNSFEVTGLFPLCSTRIRPDRFVQSSADAGNQESLPALTSSIPESNALIAPMLLNTAADSQEHMLREFDDLCTRYSQKLSPNDVSASICVQVIQQQVQVLRTLQSAQNYQIASLSPSQPTIASENVPQFVSSTSPQTFSSFLRIPQPPSKPVRKQQFKGKRKGIISNLEVITAAEEAKAAKEAATEEQAKKKRIRLEKKQENLMIKEAKDQERQKKKSSKVAAQPRSSKVAKR